MIHRSSAGVHHFSTVSDLLPVLVIMADYPPLAQSPVLSGQSRGKRLVHNAVELFLADADGKVFLVNRRFDLERRSRGFLGFRLNSPDKICSVRSGVSFPVYSRSRTTFPSLTLYSLPESTSSTIFCSCSVR